MFEVSSSFVPPVLLQRSYHLLDMPMFAVPSVRAQYDLHSVFHVQHQMEVTACQSRSTDFGQSPSINFQNMNFLILVPFNLLLVSVSLSTWQIQNGEAKVNCSSPTSLIFTSRNFFILILHLTLLSPN